jgi:hypothetical protein
LKNVYYFFKIIMTEMCVDEKRERHLKVETQDDDEGCEVEHERR